MLGVIYTKYGPPEVLQLKEIAKPVPQENQVLVKVQAASINALDFRRFEMVSVIGRLVENVLIKSIDKILGADIAGRVEAIGANVKQFRPGDEIFGVSAGSKGGFAEYACAAENQLALKPANLSFEAAAAVPIAALTALQGLRDKGQIQHGQKVLIHGTSGGVGTFAVQIAKSFGAEVTAVCSTRNVDMVRSIGADHIIDYTREDFTKNGQRYDLIIAVSGNRPLRDYTRALNTGGAYVAVGGSIAQFLQGMLLGPLVSKFGSKKVRSFITKPNQADLVFLSKLLEADKIRPIIDRCYSLSEVAEAMQYLVTEHARGKVVITVERDQ